VLVAAIILLATADLPVSPASPPTTTLTVFAAASLTDAFSDIGKSLEHDMPGLHVRFNFAGSNTLALQIEQGAGADVFAAADDQWMGHVRARGLLAGNPQTFARNVLVVIVPRTNPGRVASLRDLAKPGLKLVLAAESVPAGHYSRDVLKNLSRQPAYGEEFARRALSNLVSEEDNVRGVVAKVQLGEADAGLCYRSDASGAVSRYVRVHEIPDSLNVFASYPIAVLKDAEGSTPARLFVERVLSPQGQQALQRHGFIPAIVP
jgi:molybdate transport system substrate-binding protein